MSFPFDCISDFMFFETELEQSDIILIPRSKSSSINGKSCNIVP